MKKLIYFSLFTILFSCGTDTSLCDCIEAGEDVNKISASFFDRAPTKEGEDSLRQAKKIRDEACEQFQNMEPYELHEKAANCDVLALPIEKE